tara:strand:+ start:72 stop:1091 length:1020 start_codon:yes stop_codon:yes gene_type:complete
MDAITQHHYENIANGKAVENEDGSLSTVKTLIVEVDGREMLIPTVWDGEIVDTQTAIDNAMASGIEWPSAEPTEEGRAMLQAEDDAAHSAFDRETTPEEAQAILDSETSESIETEGLMSDTLEFRLGGFATANRGITTTEGLDMAKQKFQLDRKEADRNGDGELSDYEETTGEAIQKAMADVDDPEQDEKANLYHGGMACGDGMMSDPESGNPIPIGSSAENVRDDIEAMISEGEYVLPANVVKWHGLRHIMEMQSEAEMGLMSMNQMGLIQYASEEGEEEPEEVSEDQEDVPSEDVDIEVAAVMVDDKLDDDDEIEEIYPDTSYTPGAFQKQKVVFMS